MNRILFLSLMLFGLFSCLTQAQQTTNPVGVTGIEGTISVSPVQGGPTRAGGSDSMPLANMAFEVKRGDQVMTSFQTDDHGHFQVSLEPGHYTISRKDWKGAVGSYGPFEVDVSLGKMMKVEWNCDSGIR
jgi:hypothetical protein